jgi:putative acetyltransferase
VVEISYPKNSDEISLVRLLFKEYATSMGLDLRYQHFDKELSDLPGKYAPPTGYLR